VVLIVPLDELGNVFSDVTTRLVINQLGGFRDICVGVFVVTIASLGVLDVECRIDLVANGFGERSDVDIVGRANVYRFAVGTVVAQQAVIGVEDIGDIRY